MMNPVPKQEHSEEAKYPIEMTGMCPSAYDKNCMWQRYPAQSLVGERHFADNYTLHFQRSIMSGNVGQLEHKHSSTFSCFPRAVNSQFASTDGGERQKKQQQIINVLNIKAEPDGTDAYYISHNQGTSTAADPQIYGRKFSSNSLSGAQNEDCYAVVRPSSTIVASASTPSVNGETTQAAITRKLSHEYHAMKAMRNRVQPQIYATEESRAFLRSLPPIEIESAYYWIYVTYYELNRRVGDIFKGVSNCVAVDGFCAPSEAERFCLGALSGADRSVRMTNVRRQIGNGIIVYRDGPNVSLKSVADTQIFIQCPNYAMKLGDNPSTVYRFAFGQGMVIFDDDYFQSKFQENLNQGYDALHALQHLCHTRVSFVKGWGQQYKRQTIMETPCWVEIQLQLPLQDLDRVISAVQANEEVHSYSV